MATKTFKIGLSNTDKQNMAQDVYERVLALTFNEYDITTEYEVGDFVVYNDQLYKCIGATSGAWDSTKWQLATLNDLVDDIENAVAFFNDKANVDGNYPTMTVGVADQLSPYDENSGDDQDEPFNFQATGTGNGSQPDFSTGSIALMKEKQGNTVVVNQLINNGDFSNGTTGWVGASNVDTFTVSNKTATVVTKSGGTDNTFITKSGVTIPAGHKLLIHFKVKISEYVAGSWIYAGAYQNNTIFYYRKDLTDDSEKEILDIVTAAYPLQNGGLSVGIRNSYGSVITYTIKDVFVVDLTKWFNGDIPQDLLDNPDHFFRYYNGSLAYNEGTLVNADGRYIKCIGMNQWDEEWELGAISPATGQNVENSNAIRTKNYIKVIPSATYNLLVPWLYVYFYDANKNFIEARQSNGVTGQLPAVNDNGNCYNIQLTIPSNCCYIRARFSTVYGTTYNNDISINLYYEDEERCLTYEPYQVLTNNDTGTEVLRSAGSVKDSKTPDGTITRRVGVVDLGTLNWSGFDTGNYTDEFAVSFANGGVNALCPKYITVSAMSEFNSRDKVIRVNKDNGDIRIKDSSFNNQTAEGIQAFKTAMDGVYLFYELAEPTTEQGTTFSENLVIDDFGSMDFGGTNGVPQGALIFYPVDYKAFVDTLYNYADGTPSNLALNSELNAKFESYLKSLSGYNASATQTLKNISGTLTWVTEGE